MQEVEFGEKLECEGSVVCGMDTGRVVATFSHLAEAESFVDAYNSQSALSDLEIVQKALENSRMDLCCKEGKMYLYNDVGEPASHVFEGATSMITWAKQTIGVD